MYEQKTLSKLLSRTCIPRKELLKDLVPTKEIFKNPIQDPVAIKELLKHLVPLKTRFKNPVKEFYKQRNLYQQ